jgi:DNA mismatch endonuclease (patch repair protein)
MSMAKQRRPGVPEASSEEARQRMERTRQRDTAPEVRLRALLFALGLRYRVDTRPLPGLRRKADVLFRRARVAVYIDGCFWHGCPLHATWPKQNAAFWLDKIETNRRRDADTDRRLAEAGWLVIRVWEHEDPAEAAGRIAAAVRARTEPARPEGRPT